MASLLVPSMASKLLLLPPLPSSSDPSLSFASSVSLSLSHVQSKANPSVHTDIKLPVKSLTSSLHSSLSSLSPPSHSTFFNSLSSSNSSSFSSPRATGGVVSESSPSSPPPSSSIPPGRATPSSSPEVESLLDSIKWDGNGLAVAIAQHAGTGAILMQGFVDRDAVSATIASRKATFYSRSRKCLWTKGETSDNFINVENVYLDCDKDSIIYMGFPDGPTCHTGADTCFYTNVQKLMQSTSSTCNVPQNFALSTLYNLEEIIAKRESEISEGKPSWTKKLLNNPELLCSKIREEAGELCETLEKSEGKGRAASEMADLLYHSLVLLRLQGVKMEDVLEVLHGRFNTSGIEEKAARTK